VIGRLNQFDLLNFGRHYSDIVAREVAVAAVQGLRTAGYFLNSLSKAERGSFPSKAALVVCRSKVFRGSNKWHSLRTSFFGIRTVTDFLHWNLAPGSKLTQFLQT
jgi:hypothetical protein